MWSENCFDAYPDKLKHTVMKRLLAILVITVAGAFFAERANACTGIALPVADGGRVVARTVEWAASAMQCGYVVSPRGHQHISYTPTGENGLKYKGKYGYA